MKLRPALRGGSHRLLLSTLDEPMEHKEKFGERGLQDLQRFVHPEMRNNASCPAARICFQAGVWSDYFLEDPGIHRLTVILDIEENGDCCQCKGGDKRSA